MFNVSNIIIKEANAYTRTYIFSLFPYLLFQYYKTIYSGLGKTTVIAVSVAVSVFVNIAVNYILIYGNFGFPELGIVGAAIATCIALIVAILVNEIHAFRKYREVSVFQLHLKWHRKSFLSSIRLGIPIAVISLCETGQYYVLTIIIASFGAFSLAAHGIAFQVVCIFYGIYGGLHQGVIPFISKAFGSKDWKLLHLRQRISWYVAIFLVLS